jgi:hypothetical protein
MNKEEFAWKKKAIRALEIIANVNTNFPTQADTADILKEMRSIARDVLNET